MRLSLLIVCVLGGCVVGDTDEIDDSIGEVGAQNPGDRLRWTSLTSSCARGENGIVANGEALTVLFDQGARWTHCTFSGVLRVPADVRLRSLAQQVRTEGAQRPIRYSARVNGTQVTATTTSSRDVLDAHASLLALGDALCRKPGTGDREIPVAFTAIVDGEGVSLDSVDWAFVATRCR